MEVEFAMTAWIPKSKQSQNGSFYGFVDGDEIHVFEEGSNRSYCGDLKNKFPARISDVGDYDICYECLYRTICEWD